METKRHSFLVRVAMTLLLTVLTTVTAWADEWPEYITDVKLIGGTQTKVDELKSSYQSQGWTIINVNLNEGVANSDYIFLIYKKDNHVSTNGGYVTDLYLNATAGDHPSGYSTSSITYNGHTYSRCPYDGNSAFYTYRGHLNANAGGMEIHLYYTKENFSDKRALTSITCNYSSSGALYWWNNSNDYPANLNNGNNGSAIYMHINKTTKVNRPNPEPSMASSLVYTSKPLKLIASNYTNNNPGTLYYRVNSGDYTSTVNDVTATNAGTHTVYYYSGSDSYGNSSESYAHSKTVTIAKSPNSGATVTCGNYLEGSTPNPSLTGTNLSSGTVTFKYNTSQNGEYTTTKPSAAGTYWVKATIAGDDNCYEYTTAATSFNIIYNWRLHNSGDTEDDAYVISTQADLKYLAFWVNSGIDFAGKFFKLGDNIAFDKSKENNLTPIGTESHPFDGTFDGNKKTISGLNINKPNNDNVGLFGYATKEATIKNLTVDNSTITGGQLVGAILGCGDSKDVFSAKTTIENCLVTSSVTVSGQFCVGGIAGEKAIINGCVCAATVSGQQQVGGIIGSNSFDVTNCLYTGTNVSGTYHIGAISGEGNTSNHFHYNYYTADVTCGGGFGQNSTDIGQDDTGGRKAVTINAADGVTVTPTGTSTAYNVSGITAYAGNSCIGYDGHIYAGATEEVNLDITCSSTYESFTGYTDGNGNALASIGGTTYTLTMPATTVTVTAQDLWGEQAEGRDGSTADKAYLITTPEGLDLLAKKVNGTDGYTANSYADTYFELGNDIAYSYEGLAEGESNYTPIGKYVSSGDIRFFSGHFDGKGHKVSGVRINVNADHQGIFGSIYGSGCEVKNLTVDDTRIIIGNTNKNAGGITGYSEKGAIIENCHVTNSVTVTAQTGGEYGQQIGGIAGSNMNSAIVRGCTSAATLSGERTVGGIVGATAGNTIIENCLYTGNAFSGSSSVGAIVGYLNRATLTNNCYTLIGLGGCGSIGSTTGSDVDGAQFAYEFTAATGAMGAVVSTYAEGTDYQGITVYTDGLAYNGKYYCTIPWTGDGTAEHPFVISTTDGLDKLASKVNAGTSYADTYFELGNDIAYSYDGLGEGESNFTTIGDDNHRFLGTFDGKGHTISGIRISDTNGEDKAIFGRVDRTVKNLVVSDCCIEARQVIGGIVAILRGGTIENCHVGSDVTLTGRLYVGGIAADISEGTIKGCTSAATITGTKDSGMNAEKLGGIVGSALDPETHPTLTDNLFTGTISGDIGINIGAIIGQNNSNVVTLTNNFHTCSMGGVGSDTDTTGTDEDGALLAASSATMSGDFGEATTTYGEDDYIGITAYQYGLYYDGLYYYKDPNTVVWTGKGTETNPYVIRTTAELDLLASKVNGGNYYDGSYFVLGDDITYDYASLGEGESNYTTIGDNQHPFSGTFDGQGHKVSGIRISDTNDVAGDYKAIFGMVDGTVKNLVVSDCSIEARQNTGGIVALLQVGTIENCHVGSDVTLSGNLFFGGIAAKNFGGTIKGCTSAATITGTKDSGCNAEWLGGIVSYASEFGDDTPTLTDNLFTGTISGDLNDYIGAIIGMHDSDGTTLTNNYHTLSGVGGIGSEGSATSSDVDGAQFAVSSETKPAEATIGTVGTAYAYHGVTPYTKGLYYDGKYYWHGTVQPADANGDGQVTISDVVAIVNFILGKPVPEGFNPVAADMNGDGEVTITDAVMLMNMIGSQP